MVGWLSGFTLQTSSIEYYIVTITCGSSFNFFLNTISLVIMNLINHKTISYFDNMTNFTVQSPYLGFP